MKLEVTFPKRSEHGQVATFAWSDGLVATSPMWGRPERLPHDLGHYSVDAHFRPPYSFWTLVGQQAPFASLTLVHGRWPGGRQEWLDRIRRKHGLEMLKAESPGIGRACEPDFDVDREWPAIRRTLNRAYVFGEANPFADVTKESLARLHAEHLKLERTWDAVPVGGALVVHWPPNTAPRVVQRAGR